MLLYNRWKDTYLSYMYVMEALASYPCHVTYEMTYRHRLEDNLNSNEYNGQEEFFGGFSGLLHLRKVAVCFLIFPTNLHVYASTLPLPQSPLWWAFTVSKATCRAGERGLAEGRANRDKMQENEIAG